MNTPLPSPRLHPAILAAAISVSALSLAGIGVLTGVLPGMQKATETPPAVAQTAPASTSVTPPQAPIAKPADAAPAPAQPVKHSASKMATAPKNDTRHGGPDIEVTRKAADTSADSAIKTAASVPVATLPEPCKDCGVIESIREVAHEGEASGLGAVAGSVVGGILGNQVGAKRGKDAATLLGAIGGAVAGHQIEKSQHKTVSYEIVVRFEDGTSRVMSQATAPAWRQGDHVKVVNGMLSASN